MPPSRSQSGDTEPTPTPVLAIADGLLARDLDDCVVIYDLRSDELVELHGSGVQIWRMLASSPAGHAVLDDLDAMFGPSSRELVEARAFLDDLVRRQLVRRVD